MSDRTDPEQQVSAALHTATTKLRAPTARPGFTTRPMRVSPSHNKASTTSAASQRRGSTAPLAFSPNVRRTSGAYASSAPTPMMTATRPVRTPNAAPRPRI